MEYNEAIEIFDTLSEDDKAKEIYAHFGLSVFYAQNIEQQAIIMIAACRQVSDKVTTTEQVNSIWDNYDLGSRTLGVLINEIKQLYSLTEDDLKELKEILKLRNYIAHDYFRFNSELFYSDSGQKRMIKDFIDFKFRAQALDKKLKDYMKIYSDKAGITDELLERLMEQQKKEWEKRIITDDHNTIIK